MKAIQIKSIGETSLIEIQKPEIAETEVLIKLHYVGFCGTDLNTFRGLNPLVKLPIIPGHEIGASIAEVGAGVPKHLKPGMACTVNPYTNCGSCSSCRNGRSNACRSNQTLGVQRNGAMTEYIAVPWQKVLTDDSLTSYEFTLVEPLSVGFHAVARVEVSDLDKVMVIGCGMIGIGALVRSVLRGAQVIAVDVDDDKLALAKTLGVQHTINSKTENVHERLLEITRGEGPDVVIEAVGAPVTYQMAVQEVAFTGRIACIGYAKQDISFETKLFVQKELNICGSRNAMPEDFRAVIEYLKRGDCPIDQLVSKIYMPEQTQEALEYWEQNSGKVFRMFVQFS